MNVIPLTEFTRKICDVISLSVSEVSRTVSDKEPYQIKTDKEPLIPTYLITHERWSNYILVHFFALIAPYLYTGNAKVHHAQ